MYIVLSHVCSDPVFPHLIYLLPRIISLTSLPLLFLHYSQSFQYVVLALGPRSVGLLLLVVHTLYCIPLCFISIPPFLSLLSFSLLLRPCQGAGTSFSSSISISLLPHFALTSLSPSSPSSPLCVTSNIDTVYPLSVLISFYFIIISF